MIKHIKIKKFGRFENFNNSNINFKKLNLLYGWNYSGKTTLSRIFALYDDSYDGTKILSGYNDPEFELILDNSSVIKIEDSEKLKTKVFNSDYIKCNLMFDENLIEPLFILGEDTLKKQTKLDELSKKLNGTKTSRGVIGVISNLETSIYAKNEYINNEHTNKAKFIKHTLEITEAFNKTHLENLLSKIDTSNINQYLSLDENLRLALEREYKLPDNTNYIEELNPMQGHNIKEVSDILNKTITPSQSLEYLANNAQLEDWTYQGKSLHDGSEICLFCRQKLPDDLMDKLNNHFNKEFELFKNEIEKLKNSLMPIKLKFPHVSEFSEQFINEYKLLLKKINGWEVDYEKTYNQMVSKVDFKLSNLTRPVTLDLDFKFEEILSLINACNDLIKKHNYNKKNMSAHKTEIRERITNYYIAEMVSDKKYILYQKQMAKFSKWLESLNNEKLELIEQINSLKSEISDLHRGAETVNKYLNYFFGATGKIQIKVEDEKTKLYRNDSLATNLSEGEKTAIAIAHFLTNLDTLSAEARANTILYIDDPISSLDSNHIYAVYSKLVNLDEIYKQVFIATHNHEFYKLCTDTQGKRKNIMAKYYVERKSANSVIEKIPDIYEKFKSEYSYLFYILHNFSANPNADDLYQISNIARRFTELFTGFKVPLANNYQDKLGMLLNDTDRATKIMKCFHNGSHSQYSNGFKDLSSTEESINEILKMVQDTDIEHYNCLVKITQDAINEVT